MQIAGSVCKICQRQIVLSIKGKFYARCRTLVHMACDDRLNCDVCNQPFQQYERPAYDPISDSTIPHTLRPGAGGPTAVAVLCLGFGVLLIIVLAFAAFMRDGH